MQYCSRSRSTFGSESEETSTSGVDRELSVGFSDRLPRGDVLAITLEQKSKNKKKKEEDYEEARKKTKDNDEGSLREEMGMIT